MPRHVDFSHRGPTAGANAGPSRATHIGVVMVNISIQGDRVHFDVEGWDKLWALKSHLDIPLEHITGVRADPELARGWWHGLRLPGTEVPGLITAGSFYQKNGMVFYDVHDPEATIVLDLDHEHYKKLIIEVEHPDMAVATLQAALDVRSDARR